MSARVPHWRVVIGFCIAAIIGYAAASIWVIWFSEDAALRGDVIGTWKSFAVGAFGFWVGSSSGGKIKDGDPPKVEIEQPAGKPVPTVTTLPSPAFGVDDPPGGA